MEGRIEELRAKQAEAEASHEEFPSRITARQLQQLESDLGRLDSERTVLSQELATDNVLSKEDFFEKLDLISYGGRSAANNLVKRLGVRINVAKWGRLNEAYAVTVNAAPTFVIIHDKDDIAVRALDRASLDKLALHGDIDEETRGRLAAVGDLMKGVATQLSDQLIAQLRLRPSK
ncbi:Recombinase-related protein [Pseudomonas syringae pv. maculicola]|nr:Recombinase-related protein [Pseudomonas syringae pv. maculicola]